MRTSYYLGIKIFLSITFVISMGMMSYSQVRTNPFEVKPRLKVLANQDTLSTNAKGNPFDIASRPNIVIETPIDSLTISKVEDQSDVNKKQEAINPFDVDHVPLRKNIASKASYKNGNLSDAIGKSNNFLFWFLLLSCVLLAVSINSNTKILATIARSVINENILKQFLRGQKNKLDLPIILMYAIFVLNFSAWIFLLSSKYYQIYGVSTYLAILAGVIIVYSVKHLSLWLLGLIFGVEKNTGLYSFSILNTNIFLGFMLIPFNLLIAFGPSTIQQITIGLTILFIFILFLLRIIRGIFIVSEFLTYRIFQIFIYLCAFEIAPNLILVKTLIIISN